MQRIEEVRSISFACSSVFLFFIDLFSLCTGVRLIDIIHVIRKNGKFSITQGYTGVYGIIGVLAKKNQFK